MGAPQIYCPWEENAPEPLLDLSGKYVIRNPESFCVLNHENGMWSLRPGVALPTEICEKLLNLWQDSDPELLNDKFINIFSDIHCTRLKRVTLRSSSVTDAGIKSLLTHNLVELDISNCKYLTKRTLECINENCESLNTLVIGKTKDILPLPPILEADDISEEALISEMDSKGPILKTKNLRRFVVRELNLPTMPSYFNILLKPLTLITHVDLSGCGFLDNFSCLHHMNQLVSLNLHSVQRVQDAIGTICKMTNLRFLDISQANQKFGLFENPNSTLSTIVKSLQHLSALDISGTNLPGDGTFDFERTNKKKLEGYVFDEMEVEGFCDIPGLQSRVSNPLEFLGLYNTSHDACHRHHIPAKVITGDANEEQILAGTAAYLDRPEVLVKALNELFHIFRFETCHNQTRALNVILLAMIRHRHEKHIQISGSASLFYIAKSEEKSNLSVRAKQKMIEVLLAAMETHLDDSTMMRNGCLTLCQFRIPQDVLFEYKRLVQLLLRLIRGRSGDSDDFVRRIAIYLLNSLACQVDGEQKELVGDLGAIETMLKLINDRLKSRIHDDMLEIAWSAMWNVTDETPINCQRFLDGHGMHCFQRCLKEFPDKPELLRNMMGLLGNVAEVESLRPRLMVPELLNTFSHLLDSNSDGIEVSYNAAGVLSHMASSGADTWTVCVVEPSRAQVLERMVAAIERWDLSSKRNINYRSFEPILRLLEVFSTPECQHWAAWALANLTRVYPDKYCTLVEEEGGLVLLEAILESPLPYARIKTLARIVIRQCQHYKDCGSLELMDQEEES